MNCLDFTNVSFTYPAVEGDLDAQGKQIVPSPVFESFTGSIPAAFTSVIGPNGCGKSTLLMLAAGRLVPQTGKVTLFGQDVAALDEEKKNLLASVIYQNMEFESEDETQKLLEFVYKNGALKANAKGIKSSGDLFSEATDVFELDGIMGRRLTELSKGETQRVLLAFSILYGSAAVFMDEPMFAMEDRQKNAALEYLRQYSDQTKTAMFISMHELDLSRRYAEKVLLIHPNKNMDYGTPEEVMTDADLEKAYGFPASMLKHNEDMTREQLKQVSEAIKSL